MRIPARFLLPAHEGREAAVLTLGAPLARVRHAVLRSGATRFFCLAEEPGGELATVLLQRRGNQLVAELEHPAGLDDASIAVLLDGDVRYGTRGLRARLPAEFDASPNGVPFSVGVVGRAQGTRRITWRRWAGGLPADLLSGAPGRLFAGQRA